MEPPGQWLLLCPQSFTASPTVKMKLAASVSLLLHSLLLTAAQEEPRLGPDGRPLLNKPRPEMCRDRKYHEKYGKHHYFLSWREPWNKFEDWDWFNARNFCRERCMDLVSFEDPEEYRHFAKMLHRGRDFYKL